MRHKILGSLLLLSGALSAAFADEVANPCTGILNFVNRPSAAHSACVVPFKKGVFQSGVQYQNVKGGKRGYNFPQVALHLGLPAKTEFEILAPNFTHQTIQPRSGWGPTMLGLKHELGYNAKWLGTMEGLVTLPSGGNDYGSDGLGGIVNGIINYKINSNWGMTFMLGVSTQTLPYSAGGQRYNSVNPDLLLSWQATEKLKTFGEIYGQSKTAPKNGAGFNADAGILYAWTPNLETDLALGQRISGKLGNFNNYIGAGFGWLF